MCSEGKRAAWLWWVLATSGGMMSPFSSAFIRFTGTWVGGGVAGGLRQGDQVRARGQEVAPAAQSGAGLGSAAGPGSLGPGRGDGGGEAARSVGRGWWARLVSARAAPAAPPSAPTGGQFVNRRRALLRSLVFRCVSGVPSWVVTGLVYDLKLRLRQNMTGHGLRCGCAVIIS